MEEPITAEKFSELVGLIYDCAIDPALWPIAMDAIRAELNFHNATLDLIALPSGEAIAAAMCNVPPQYLPAMVGAGPDVIEAWGGQEVLRTFPLDTPMVQTRTNPGYDIATATNRYALEFVRPQGIIDAMSIGLARDARAMGAVSFGRHASAGPIGEREIAVAQMLVPHLQRAATINRMLEGAALAQQAFAATLDTLAAPVILVDGQLQMLLANPAAQRLLDDGALVRIEAGALRAATPGASNALAAAIGQAARDESGIGRRGLGIPVRGPDASFGALHVLPLGQGRRHVNQGAVAAVFIARADSPFVAPTEVAAALFGLTPAEARVFEHLVTGHTQAGTATALGIERSTVKTHLERLYDKIGVRSQADLVHVAVSLAIPAIG
jgi:DNA-binding CsgD family transcriptional regulator/PAS domain-containing protein